MITYDITLCVGMAKQDEALTVKCCDTGINLRVSLQVCRHGTYMDKLEAYSIPEGCTPVLKIAKPDKTYCIQDGAIQANQILFAVKPQAFTAAGTAQAEVSLYKEDGRRITSATFDIKVPPECVCECETESGNYVDVMSERIRAAIDAAVQQTVEEYLDKNPPADGKDGYTPVKGVDYFTMEEQAEMVTAVLAALPAAEGVSY